jgi:beta-lactamase superfamily II metal-dependent hydrolase
MGFLIDMIAVGQGDALLLTLDTPLGEAHFLVDGGPPSAGDLVADFVIEHAGGHLDAMIASHLDIDHVGGLKRVAERCRVDNLYANLPPHVRTLLSTLISQKLDHKKAGKVWDRIEESLNAAADLIDVLGTRRVFPQQLLAGQSFPLNNGNVRLNVLSPTPARLEEAWAEIEEDESTLKKSERTLSEAIAELAGLEAAPETTAENNSSIVLEIVYKGVPYALLTADAGADVLREVTNGNSYRFLKVPHHGSKTGLDETLIAQLSPATAYIPVGPNNYGHPANDILDLLRTHGAATYCSERVNHCRQACPTTGARNICHKHDRAGHPKWTPIPHCTN